MKHNKARTFLALAVAWLVIPLVLLELILRVVGPNMGGQLGAAVRRVMFGTPYAAGYNNPWLPSPEHWMIVKPDLRNVLQCGTPSVCFHLTTNRFGGGAGVGSEAGFRIPAEITFGVDLLFIGDSHTFCFTEESDCWVTRLNQATGLDGLNFGQPVTGSTSHLRYLEAYGPSLRPPLVVWQFVGNDFNDDYGLAVLRGDVAKIDYEYPDAPLPPDHGVWGWFERNSVLVAAVQQIIFRRTGNLTAGELQHSDPYSVVYRDGILQFGRWIEQQVADMDNPRNQAGLAITRANLTRAQAVVSAWDGQMVVLLVPTRELVYRSLTEPIMGMETWQKWYSAHKAMLDLCAEQNLICIDALPELQRRADLGEHLYWTDDPHLNPHGNAVLAQIVETYLRDNALLPTNR
jgi:hypothetical protein